MPAAKKKTRKELLKGPDEFITVTSRVIGWADRRRKQIQRALLALLAIGVLVSGYIYYLDRQEGRAAALTAQALEKLERLGAGKPTPESVQAAAEDFNRILDAYGSRSNGSIARVIYAHLRYETGDYRQAAELYQASLPRFADQPIIRFQILESLAYTYAALQEPATAAGYFEQALAGGAKELRDDVLFNLGDLYARSGQPEKSTASYRRILNEHPDSVYASLVRSKVDD